MQMHETLANVLDYFFFYIKSRIFLLAYHEVLWYFDRELCCGNFEIRTLLCTLEIHTSQIIYDLSGLLIGKSPGLVRSDKYLAC